MEAAEYMSASGEHGCPLAGIAQTRIVAPASGTPRELKTMSSLREPWACAGETTPGHTCSASVSSAQKHPIAIFDRIIRLPFLMPVNSLRVDQASVRAGLLLNDRRHDYNER